jgi:hypothetical protein
MSDTPDPITKQDLINALAELKAGRSRARGRRYIYSIMRRYGGDARNIHELDPKFYPAVYTAAGGDILTAEKFYGAVIDLPPTITIPTPEEFFGVVTDVPTRRAKSGPPPSRKSPTRPTLRLRTPLTLALEAELAKVLAKTKRSVPNYVVNTGNASRAEDQDDSAVQDFPAGERVS